MYGGQAVYVIYADSLMKLNVRVIHLSCVRIAHYLVVGSSVMPECSRRRALPRIARSRDENRPLVSTQKATVACAGGWGRV